MYFSWKKSIVIIFFTILFVLGAYFFYSNLPYSIKYKPQLEKARNLLQDEYSKEVFDYAIKVWENFPEYTSTCKDDAEKLADKYYIELENPNVPIRKGDVVIDGGVSVYTVLPEKIMKMVGKNGFLIGFEPNTTIIDIAEDELSKTGNNYKIYPVGLWDKNTVKKFHSKDLPDTSTFKNDWYGYSIKITSGNGPREQIINAKLVKLDDFILKKKIKKIDYIHLNIEGSELEALKGAKNILKTMKPKLSVVLEHHPTQLFNIIFYLNSLNLGYKFYLGFHVDRIITKDTVNSRRFELYAIAE